MSTTNHTQGLVKVSQENNTTLLIVAPWSDQVPADADGMGDYRGIHIARITHDSTEGGAAPFDHANANAKRIQACWNACQGISTENLENNLPVRWLVRQYNDTLSALNRIANTYTGALEPHEVEDHLRQIARDALARIRAEGAAV